MTTETEIRAEQARQLLNNPLFEETFFNVREAIISQIEHSEIVNEDFRNQLGLQLQALANIKDQIKDSIDTAMLDMDEESNKFKQ